MFSLISENVRKILNYLPGTWKMGCLSSSRLDYPGKLSGLKPITSSKNRTQIKYRYLFFGEVFA